MSKREIKPQQSLPELRVTPTRSQLFMFSAVTWNRHLIHFDKDQAQNEGFPDVAVQRGLLGNFLARLATGFAGPTGRLERLSWRVAQSAFPGNELVCQGEVTRVESRADGKRVVDCAVRALNPEGALVASGEARVVVE